jgi:regulator of sigma E protease
MTILIAILALIFLIVIHELGHMLTSKALGVRVPEFGIGFGPPLFRKKLGKTHYSFRIILLGGFAKIAGMGDGEEGEDTYYAKPVWRRALIIFAGPAVNIMLAPLALAGIIYTSGAPEPTATVDSVEKGTMAAKVGIQEGDKIVAVDGQKAENWEGFVGQVQSKEPGDRISVTVQRDGQREQFSGVLSASPQNPDRAIVGVSSQVVRKDYGPLDSLAMGVQRTGEITAALGGFVGQLITGEKSFTKNVSSPVGIVAASGQVLSQSVTTFAILLAFISLQLGILNLLPILPLDGGHLLMLAAEKVTGHQVSEQTMMRIAAMGLAMILTLFVFAIYADVSKIVSGQPFIPK